MAKKRRKYDIGTLLCEARAKKQQALNASDGTIFTGSRRKALSHFDKIIWLCGQLKKAQKKN